MKIIPFSLSRFHSDSNGTHRGFSIFSAALAWLIVLCSVDLFVQRQVMDLAGPAAVREIHHNDFRHMYAAASLLRSGGNIYDSEQLRAEAARREVERLNPYVYPPLQAALLIPLASLSFAQAALAWYWINIFLVVLCILILSRLLGSMPRPWNCAIVVFLVAASEPVTRTLTAGQMNIALLLLLCLSFILFKKNYPVFAGLALGLAAALKIFPALLILMLFWRRRYRAGMAALLGALALTLLGCAIAGWSHSLDYLALLRQMSYGSSTWAQLGMHYHVDPANQAPAALITRLLTQDPDAGVQGIASLPGLAKFLSAATGLILFGIAFYFTRFKHSEDNSLRISETSLALAILASILIPSLMWDHYLTLALLPAVILLDRPGDCGRDTAVLILIALSLFVIDVPVNFWNPAWQSGWRVAWSSVKLPAVLVLFGLLAWRARMLQRRQ